MAAAARALWLLHVSTHSPTPNTTARALRLQSRVLRELEDAGFDAQVVSWAQPTGAAAAGAGGGGRAAVEVVQLSVKGMTCAACSTAVEKALLGVGGVVKASVALTQGKAEVHFDPAATTTVRRGAGAGRERLGGCWVARLTLAPPAR